MYFRRELSNYDPEAVVELHKQFPPTDYYDNVNGTYFLDKVNSILCYVPEFIDHLDVALRVLPKHLSLSDTKLSYLGSLQSGYHVTLVFPYGFMETNMDKIKETTIKPLDQEWASLIMERRKILLVFKSATGNTLIYF